MNGFALCVGLGATFGLWRVARNAPKQQTSMLIDIGLLILLACLAGARLGYAWINREYFWTHPLEIVQFWTGGLSWPGALSGAWVAFLLISLTIRNPRGGRFSPGQLGDALYPLLPPLTISTWLGSWLAGTAYGPALPAGTWWAVPSLDESGSINLHWPLQLLAALSMLAFFWLLEMLVKNPKSAGLLSGLAVFGIILHLFVASLLRADPMPLWRGIRIDTCMSIVFLGIFLLTVLFFRIANQFWVQDMSFPPVQTLRNQDRA